MRAFTGSDFEALEKQNTTVPKTKLNLFTATLERTEEKRLAASKVASENADVAEQLLKDFEISVNKTVTKEQTIMPETEFVDGKIVAKGQPQRRLVYDPEAARKAGKSITEEIDVIERKLAEIKSGKTTLEKLFINLVSKLN